MFRDDITSARMSKAFTRESDDAPEEFTPRPRVALPPGVRNYMTSAGAQRLRDERERLLQDTRPRLVKEKANVSAGVESSEARRRLQALDGRVREIEEILESAEVVEPARTNTDRVQFGARVTVRNEAGEESSYHIVGAHESDTTEGRVSWLSPIAKALMNARAGDTVKFRTPDGEVRLSVAAVGHSP